MSKKENDPIPGSKGAALGGLAALLVLSLISPAATGTGFLLGLLMAHTGRSPSSRPESEITGKGIMGVIALVGLFQGALVFMLSVGAALVLLAAMLGPAEKQALKRV